MLYSKVRIEFNEEVEKGLYNTYAFESGSTGDGRIEEDLADVVGNLPRPLATLAEAVVQWITDHSSHEDGMWPETRLLLDAAKGYAEVWRKMDRLNNTGK